MRPLTSINWRKKNERIGTTKRKSLFKDCKITPDIELAESI